MQKIKSVIIGVLIILLAIAILFVGLVSHLYPYKNSVKQDVNTQTADWKTYKNDDWGVEFKYPNDWAIEQEEIPWVTRQEGLVLSYTLKPLNKSYFVEESGVYPIGFIVYDTTLNEYLERWPDKKQVVNINGNSFVEVKVSSTYYEHGYYIDLSNKNWVGFAGFFNNINDPYLESSLSKMLSTFKFTK